MHKRYEFQQQTILADKFLTKNEKTEALKILNKEYDRDKLLFNSGTKRICENCNQECLATLYCEYCIRNYLKVTFSNWTSGNDDIDNLIQKCQMETLMPERIIEWIPYSTLEDIKFLTKGGCSEIYTANWIEGYYIEWDSKKQQLERFGRQKIILKKLENVESANQSWFEEAKSHLTISNKWASIVKCYGLTQDPSSGNYMLIINEMDVNLREYLQQNRNKLTWKERIEITLKIVLALSRIHQENAIHRDLHSGNILYSQLNNNWYISDLGFCGPANKPPTSIYGNLPYVAPEVIVKKEYTFASDIYSIAMLMWEILSGQPPLMKYKHDYDLVINIINGMRPKIVSGTPLEYKCLIEQCWDANPLKRPNILVLWSELKGINLSYHQNNNLGTNEISNIETNKDGNIETNYTSSRLITSKVYQFENLPEPKNATEEQEAFHSKPYNYNIPDSIDDFNKSSNYTFEDNSENDSSKEFNELQISSKNGDQVDYYEVIIPQQIKKRYIDTDDENEVHNNPNLHAEEQDEFEIPDVQ
ncbi:kinase-like domain-containing protein [Glomus cerebriforme]|uniref:Kinase-like domain-containing protein n=1 Tax=Glomus cerebriforme TaxID=658196 RepID=A0A397SQX8_9GLOM|nr:kinase-like domain-containing protein [Glomus cerebriforme]